RMLYPPKFFSLQLTFARKITQLTQRPYHDTVLNMTALYRILGLDWSLDPRHPVWQTYLKGLHQEGTDTDWSYQFYLERADQIPSYHKPRWGCFSYEYWSERRMIHLHFANLDGSGYGPLSHQRKEARLAELWSMFMHIKRVHPDAVAVHGSSWLYNVEAYCRLFPVEFRLSARTDTPHLIARSLWAQFLRHDGRLNEERAEVFLDRLNRLEEEHQYAQCFPYQVLITEAPISLFYTFYGL
ncbi:MAG TPA: hypothetical protein VIX20_10285, partial [Ktedonobacteraceae bacterium]